MSLRRNVTNIIDQGEYNASRAFTLPVTDMYNHLDVGHHLIDSSEGGGSIAGAFPAAGTLQTRFSNLRGGPFGNLGTPYTFTAGEEVELGGFEDARHRYFDMVWTPDATLITPGTRGGVVANGDGTFTITILSGTTVLTTDDFVTVYNALGWTDNAAAETLNTKVTAATPGVSFSYVSDSDPGGTGASTVDYGYGFVEGVYGISVKVIACMKNTSGDVGA